MSKETITNNWENVVAPVRNDMVFEGKNKSYGAYALRKDHNRRLAISLLISGSVFFLLVSIPKIIDWLNNVEEELVVPITITTVDLTPPPPIDETEPPPPPPPPPPPMMKTIKFTPPVVTDEEIVDEEPPPIQVEEPPQIAVVTQDGAEDEIIIPEEKTEVVQPVEDKPFLIVEDPPSFPGGFGELQKFILNNLVYPEMEKEAGISGTCYVSFVVDRDGSITNVELAKGINGGTQCNKEAIRVVKKMPNWKPGRQGGNLVKVALTLPIKFRLN